MEATATISNDYINCLLELQNSGGRLTTTIVHWSLNGMEGWLRPPYIRHDGVRVPAEWGFLDAPTVKSDTLSNLFAELRKEFKADIESLPLDKRSAVITLASNETLRRSMSYNVLAVSLSWNNPNRLRDLVGLAAIVAAIEGL